MTTDQNLLVNLTILILKSINPKTIVKKGIKVIFFRNDSTIPIDYKCYVLQLS